jgi:hypothetical protein
MIELPDPERAFDYENGFYLTCATTRIGKLIAHYELFKQASLVRGAVVECGVLKGCSLVRFAMFRKLLGVDTRIVGFDTFGAFPETRFGPDIPLRQRHVDVCGQESISRDQLQLVLARNQLDHDVDLIEGDILETVPAYLRDHPDLQIALLNIDVDIYEPTCVILEHLYPRVVSGGVVLLDDYKVFPGETKAVDDYFAGRPVKILQTPYSPTPHYFIKP